MGGSSNQKEKVPAPVKFAVLWEKLTFYKLLNYKTLQIAIRVLEENIK